MRSLLFSVICLTLLIGCSSGSNSVESDSVSISPRGESLPLPTSISGTAEILQGPFDKPCETINEDPVLEAGVIDLLNQARSEAGLLPLEENALLSAMARQHSQRMACLGFFDHLDPELGGVEARTARVGYSYSALGENIAAGISTPTDLVAAWMSSPGHRQNILNANFSQLGVGYSMIGDSDSGQYWTLVLGSP